MNRGLCGYLIGALVGVYRRLCSVGAVWIGRVGGGGGGLYMVIICYSSDTSQSYVLIG